MIREGERGRELYALVEGQAKITRKGRRVSTMHAGDFFGEIALVTGAPRTTSVVTETPVRTLVLTHADSSACCASSRRSPARCWSRWRGGSGPSTG